MDMATLGTFTVTVSDGAGDGERFGGGLFLDGDDGLLTWISFHVPPPRPCGKSCKRPLQLPEEVGPMRVGAEEHPLLDCSTRKKR